MYIILIVSMLIGYAYLRVIPIYIYDIKEVID